MRISRFALVAVVAGGVSLAACGDDSTKSPGNDGGDSVTTVIAPTTVDAMEDKMTDEAMSEDKMTDEAMSEDKMTEPSTTGG